MYIYMYIFKYICTCIYTYINKYICVYIYKYVCIYIYTHIWRRRCALWDADGGTQSVMQIHKVRARRRAGHRGEKPTSS